MNDPNNKDAPQQTNTLKTKTGGGANPPILNHLERKLLECETAEALAVFYDTTNEPNINMEPIQTTAPDSIIEKKNKDGGGGADPDLLGQMLAIRRTRERIKSQYRETQRMFKAKLRLLDNSLVAIFEGLDEAESGQMSLFDVQFDLPPEVKSLINNS